MGLHVETHVTCTWLLHAGMNILVATPGRLLQHMDETPGFDCSQVKVLILDEADRCMDMGFQATMDAIILNLPHQRQTLLFSATQSKRWAPFP
jgi:ATP-dependent RNA helicase DDX10/DBP4